MASQTSLVWDATCSRLCFPLLQEMTVTPSGRLPSARVRHDGWRSEEILAEANDRCMTPCNAAWQWWLLWLHWLLRPCVARASTPKPAARSDGRCGVHAKGYQDASQLLLRLLHLPCEDQGKNWQAIQPNFRIACRRCKQMGTGSGVGCSLQQQMSPYDTVPRRWHDAVHKISGGSR